MVHGSQRGVVGTRDKMIENIVETLVNIGIK
jgi:hypothetical protein